MSKSKEKRQYQRVVIELPAQCEITGPPQMSFPAKVIDIAPEGICFTTPHILKAGTNVSLIVELDREGHVKLTAQVIWSSGAAKTKDCRAGVKIADIAKEDLERFIRFYCQKLFHFLKTKKKILIIEDEEDMVDMLTMELEHRQYEVISATDGETGFTKYLTEWPDLIILDVMLPQLNGYEVCRKIRRERKDSTTPIIMLTAKAGEADKIVGGVVGAEKYITKPFDAEELIKEIEKFLNPPAETNA